MSEHEPTPPERTGHIVMGPSVISSFGDWATCDMTRHCSECGYEINEPADVCYCWHCGARLVG